MIAENVTRVIHKAYDLSIVAIVHNMSSFPGIEDEEIRNNNNDYSIINRTNGRKRCFRKSEGLLTWKGSQPGLLFLEVHNM